MWLNPQETADLVIFTEELLYGTIVQNATFRDFYSTHAPILLSFPCSYFLKIVSWKFLLPHKESENVNLWSSPSVIFVSFRNVWPLISWFHWNKSGKLNMCRSFSCSNFTISFVKKQIVWKLISQKKFQRGYIFFSVAISFLVVHITRHWIWVSNMEA